MRNALGAALVICLTVSGCGSAADDAPLAAPTDDALASESASPAAAPEPEVSETAAAPVDLDYGALDDRSNPERLLHFFADAVRKGAWAEAARAWSADADVTAEHLQAAFTGTGHVELVFGKGDSQSAAGTSFYVAPLVVDFTDKQETDKRGTIVLRRANDVPGASEQQLSWRIERSDVMLTIRK